MSDPTCASLIGPHFDPTRTDLTFGGPVEECDSWYIDVSPGDMTRYRLLTALAPDGALIVHWLSSGKTYKTDRHCGGWIQQIGGRSRGERGDEYDREAIGRILDAHIRTNA